MWVICLDKVFLDSLEAGQEGSGEMGLCSLHKSSFGFPSPITVETSAYPLTHNSPLAVVLWKIKMEGPQ